jgi:hypothetical protein
MDRVGGSVEAGTSSSRLSSTLRPEAIFSYQEMARGEKAQLHHATVVGGIGVFFSPRRSPAGCGGVESAMEGQSEGALAN